MNGLWDILSVAIGVSFIFMILSILNSWIQDNIATVFNIRAKNLADIMQNLLEPGATKLNGFERARAPLGDILGETTQDKKPSKHVLKNEDTLNRIAEKLHISIADLRNANLKTLDKWPLPDGANLNIPKYLHEVKGDIGTLENIAKKYGTNAVFLQKWNGQILDELLLPVGTELKIPNNPYTVTNNNNSLSKIAGTKEKNPDELLKANHRVLEKLNLPIGTKLKIPKVSYKTQDNEGLNDIAVKFGISDDSMLKIANPNVSFATLLPRDTEIVIPEISRDVDGSARTLKDIAEKYGRPIDVLQNENLEVLRDFQLPKKTKLTIPDSLYKVEGENNTLAKVAEKYKSLISSADPLRVLRTKNLDTLKTLPLLVWTELEIPATTYKVRGKVNTLIDIAKKYGRPTDILWIANLDILSQLPMPVDTKLTIPDPNANGYEVMDGDNLNKIALKLGVFVNDLKKANPDIQSILPEDPLTVGITLKVPEQDIGQMVSREKVLEQLIANPVRTLYRYPSIHSLSKPSELPDRIPTKDFTVALLDLLDDIGRGDEGKKPSEIIEIQFIVQGIEKLENMGKDKQLPLEKTGKDKQLPLEKIRKYKHHPLAFRLRSLLYTAQINTQVKLKITETEKTVQADIEELQKVVSEWFDDTVARGSLWYKRRMQTIGIICGFLLAIFLNADTIGISNALWHNAVLRESISQAAEASAQRGQPTGKEAQKQLEELMDIGLPIGWSFTVETPEKTDSIDNADKGVAPKNPRAVPTGLGGWVSKIIGLLLTGFAISQGSQIWFDLMNRLLNLRSGVTQSSSDESKDKEKK